MGLSSRNRGRGWFGVAVAGAVAQPRVEDVAAASGQADEGGVAPLALGPLPVVVGAAGRVGQGCEGGEEERAFELAVAGAGRRSPLIDVPELRVTGAMPA